LLEVVLILVLLAGFYFLASFFWPFLFGGAGYTPTPIYNTKEALEIAEVGPNDTLYDLGCGMGSVLTEAQKRGAAVVGVEIEPLRWLVCRLRVRNARVLLGNMFKVPLKDATVVFLFQYPGVNKRLKAKLESELAPGARVVSYYWKIEGWEPVKTSDNLYLYTIKENKN
jgi:SAM-dependent methyltransferase